MTYQPSRILITGAAGFIGANFVRWLAHHHPDVHTVAYDALTYAGNQANLDGLDPAKHTFIHGDIRDVKTLAFAMRGCDSVIHFAAESHVDRSIDGATTFLDTNIVGTHHVFDAARDAEISRVLHISTDEVYGSLEEGEPSWDETCPLEPNSPYAVSKAAADQLASAYRRTYGLPVIITRTANNYGPYQHVEKYLPRSITNLLAGTPIQLYGDGTNIRDWTHVQDNAAAQWLALTAGQDGETYNVGAGNERTNHQIATAVADALDIDHDEAITRVDDRPGHDRRYSVDTTKIRELGWAPQISLEDGIASTIEWYRTNTSWWQAAVEGGKAGRLGLGRPTATR